MLLTDTTAPANITNLQLSAGTNEGEVRLQWTAPGNDVFAGNADAYLIKLATYQITTALFDLAPTYTPAPIWVPVAGGSSEDRVIGGLEFGTTYYAAIVAFDDVGNESIWQSVVDNPAVNTGNFAPAGDLAPPIVTGVTASAVGNQIHLSWDASPAVDLSHYRVVRDEIAPANVFLDHATTTATTYIDSGLVVGNTYFYRIIAIDRGAPLFNGNMLESAPSVIVSTAIVPQGDVLAPDVPMGLKGTLDSSGIAFTLLWEEVTQNSDGSPLGDLAGYNIYRRTTLTGIPTKLTPVPLTVRAFADVVNNQTLYYTVRSIDTTGNESPDSLIADSSAEANVIFIGPDDLTTVTVPGSVNDLLRSAYNKYGVPLTIAMSEEPIPSNTEIIRHIRLQLLRGDTKTALADIAFAKPQSIVAIAYNLVGGQVGYGSPLISATKTRLAAVSPNQLSLFWNNGVTWVKVGGTVDPAAQVVRIRSSYLGSYQLRVAAAATSLTLEQANVYPRVFTPNDDGFNDRVYFVLENPNSSAVSGDIYDLGGRHVASLAQQGATGIGTTLIWDGRDSSGAVAPGGAYVYKIKGEGKTFTGTVGVAR